MQWIHIFAVQYNAIKLLKVNMKSIRWINDMNNANIKFLHEMKWPIHEGTALRMLYQSLWFRNVNDFIIYYLLLISYACISWIVLIIKPTTDLIMYMDG